jgi:hypothetical protein
VKRLIVKIVLDRTGGWLPTWLARRILRWGTGRHLIRWI